MTAPVSDEVIRGSMISCVRRRSAYVGIYDPAWRISQIRDVSRYAPLKYPFVALHGSSTASIKRTVEHPFRSMRTALGIGVLPSVAAWRSAC